VTVFELAVGVGKCREPHKEAAKVARFLASVHVLPLDGDAARRAGALRATLEKHGQVIGPYDVLLAGQALSHGLKMITGNVGEFSRVDGLQVEGW
jgi:tRNA(fMet)-specific endonuclease VapC